MLCLGKLGLAWGKEIRPSRLTPEEQKTHFSLWCLLAAPLLIGCDLTQIDPATLAILTNDELVDIDQDPLGIPAKRVMKKGPIEIWKRPLWNGTSALGIFNRANQERQVPIRWADIGVQSGKQTRDLWTHQEIGSSSEIIHMTLPAHGCAIIQVGQPQQEGYIL